jgi:hypothetical protein
MSTYRSYSIDAYLYLHMWKLGNIVVHMWLYFYKLFIYNYMIEEVYFPIKDVDIFYLFISCPVSGTVMGSKCINSNIITTKFQ